MKITPKISFNIGDKLRKRDSPDNTYTVRQIVVDRSGVTLFLSSRGQHALTINAADAGLHFMRVKSPS